MICFFVRAVLRAIRPLGGYLSDSWEEHLIPHNILGPHIYSVFFHPVALSPLVKVTQAVWMQREWGKKKEKRFLYQWTSARFFLLSGYDIWSGFLFYVMNMNFIVMISSISSQLAYNEADLKRDQELKEGLVTSALFYFSGLRKEFTKFFYYMLKYMCNFLCK